LTCNDVLERALRHLALIPTCSFALAGHASKAQVNVSGHAESDIARSLVVCRLQDDPSQGDAQLVNSAYLDNDSMELYHGRLDKKPNAIALRLRWCGHIIFVCI
jgi:SPX domain protein involved in polyphosphate accumulation